MKNEDGRLLYVVGGESSKEAVTRTLYADSHEHAVERYVRLEPTASCIDVDLLTRTTSDDYGVFFANCEQICVNPKEISNEY